MKLVLITLMCVVAFAASATVSARADDDDERDHELARKALIEGRIRPLAEITETVKPGLPGKILGVELEVGDGGRFVYDFDVLTPDGRLMEVEVDAATAEVLSIEDDD